MEVFAVAACGAAFALCQWTVSTLPRPVPARHHLVVWPPWPPWSSFSGSGPALAPSSGFEHDPLVEAGVGDSPRLQVLRAPGPPTSRSRRLCSFGGRPRSRPSSTGATLTIPVAGLDNAISRLPAEAPAEGAPVPGAREVPKLDYLASGGSAVFIAALFSALVCGLGAGETLRGCSAGRSTTCAIRPSRWPASSPSPTS